MDLGDVLTVLVIVTVLCSVVAVRALTRSSRRWGDVLRSRLLLGVPWGTLVVIGFVLAVYLFVQDGVSDFSNPVVLPYRAWSYFYPLGIVVAPFAHASESHLVGNLIGTIVIAPIAEYAWGHYPHDRGEESGSSWRTSPWIRAFVIFPAAVIGIGLLTGIFALGPVIGFSGVVFAFAGFAIVRYPIVTIVAAIGAQGTVSTIYRALQSPIFYYTAQPRPPAPPSWATIAVQGHAIGFFFGLVLAIVIFRRRGYRPDPLSLWLAVLFYGFSKSLWAIYWFEGANRYILYRGPGVIVVTALALVIITAVVGSRRSILPAALERRLSRPTADPAIERICSRSKATFDSSVERFDGDRVREILTRPRVSTRFELPARRHAAFVVVVLVVALVSGPAIPVNLFVVDEGMSAGDTSITIEDYDIGYAEGVENPLVSAIDIAGVDAGGALESNGVIVSSEKRHIWTEAVTTRRLAFSGHARVHVGGPGWRETVHVKREGWEPVGNDTVYQVWLRPADGERKLAYTSESSQAQAQIDGKRVSIVAENGSFAFEVSGNETAVVDVPGRNESVTANGLEFIRLDDEVFVRSNETVVQIATRETYN